MTAATDLWASVELAYDAAGLVALTNIRDRSATTVNDTVGESAAQEVVDLWPVYAQEDYDSTNAAHVAVGRQAVIAVLWRRGGAATTIEQVKWDEVFGEDGMIAKVRRTNARARLSPGTNSAVQQSPETTTGGRQVRGWSDPNAIPLGILPRRVPVDFE